MHYKNGREAKNGDKVVLLTEQHRIVKDKFGDSTKERLGAPVIGILYDATAGNDYCNGKLAPINQSDACPNLKECLHLDDFLAALPAEVPDTSKPNTPAEHLKDEQ